MALLPRRQQAGESICDVQGIQVCAQWLHQRCSLYEASSEDEVSVSRRSTVVRRWHQERDRASMGGGNAITLRSKGRGLNPWADMSTEPVKLDLVK